MALSQELVLSAVLCSVYASLTYFGEALVEACRHLLHVGLSGKGSLPGPSLAHLAPACGSVLRALFPLLAVPLVAAWLVSLLQTGFLVAVPGMGARPAGGLAGIFAPEGWQRSLLTAVKVSVVAGVLGSALLHSLRGLLDTWQSDPAQIARMAFVVVRDLLARAAGVLCALGTADLLYQHLRRRQRLRMSRRELDDEHRANEGHPGFLGERKRRWREVAAQAGLAELARASLLVHDAAGCVVALRFAPDEHPAPRLWIKGEGEVAQRILEGAARHGLPMHHDAALTAALSRLELAQPVPSTFFSQVARLVAGVRERP